MENDNLPEEKPKMSPVTLGDLKADMLYLKSGLEALMHFQAAILSKLEGKSFEDQWDRLKKLHLELFNEKTEEFEKQKVVE